MAVAVAVERTITLSGGPLDGQTRDFAWPLQLRLRFKASPELHPPSRGPGPVRLREHVYVREDAPKLYLGGSMAVAYRYEGTR